MYLIPVFEKLKKKFSWDLRLCLGVKRILKRYFQALELAAQQMGVDVLISGHTHEAKIYEKGIYLLN